MTGYFKGSLNRLVQLLHEDDLLCFYYLVQTLGIGHAFSSFIWLCGPITGLVVRGFYSFLSN